MKKNVLQKCMKWIWYESHENIFFQSHTKKEERLKGFFVGKGLC